jgi:hypothetical protein
VTDFLLRGLAIVGCAVGLVMLTVLLTGDTEE